MSDYKYSNKIFIERASELIFNSGETQAELVEHLGLSNGSVANLKNKKGQTPSAETVCALANYFNVSTDWLLGLTDVQTTDKATKELCDTLGLSEETIKCFQDSTDPYAKISINWLVKQHMDSMEKAWNEEKEILTELKEIAITNYKSNYYEHNMILKNSILWNLSQIIKMLNNVSEDMHFIINNKGTLKINFFNQEGLFKTGTIEAFENLDATPPVEFDYKEILLLKHINSIQTQLNNLSETVKKQYNDKTVTDLIKFYTQKKEGSTDGNDKKEE